MKFDVWLKQKQPTQPFSAHLMLRLLNADVLRPGPPRLFPTRLPLLSAVATNYYDAFLEKARHSRVSKALGYLNAH